jgi:hypothetical protein
MAPLRRALHILPDVLVPALRAPEPFDLSLLDPLETRLTTLADDLSWWAAALKAARSAQPERLGLATKTGTYSPCNVIPGAPSTAGGACSR